MQEYGLLGKSLAHTFSPDFFNNKFSLESIDAVYHAFELSDIDEFPELLASRSLSGLNVTIPYKEQIIPYLDCLDETAEKIQAVNCIQMHKGILKGYNTDAGAFLSSLEPLLCAADKHGLVLGTGGASKAVVWALEKLELSYQLVSRNPQPGMLSYDELSAELMQHYTVIINTTPLGMYPNEAALPELPYEWLTERHLLYDLIYRPATTAFLKMGAGKGARTKNGMEMLQLQALASWEIWNED